MLFAGEFDGSKAGSLLRKQTRRSRRMYLWCLEIRRIPMGIDLGGLQLRVCEHGRLTCLVVLPDEEYGDRGDRYLYSERH